MIIHISLQFIKLFIFFLQEVCLQPLMSTFGIEFAVTCETNFGQKVCICGNLAVFGQWEPSKSVRLQTDHQNYPLWFTVAPIPVRHSTKVEFKLCIIDAKEKIIRWEVLPQNRVFIARGSLLIQFLDSNERIVFKTPRRKSENIIEVQNVRKGTEEVIQESEQS